MVHKKIKCKTKQKILLKIVCGGYGTSHFRNYERSTFAIDCWNLGNDEQSALAHCPLYSLYKQWLNGGSREGKGPSSKLMTNIIVQPLWNCCRKFSEIRATRWLLLHSDFTTFNFAGCMLLENLT